MGDSVTFLTNRLDRTWDRSGRVTAVLPNNSYYVSLDGSRRVTQRMRAHIKPIAIFPIHLDDASSDKPQPVVNSDAAIISFDHLFFTIFHNFSLTIFRCVLASLYEGLSVLRPVRPSVGPSVRLKRIL